jgi:hypothetical protein
MGATVVHTQTQQLTATGTYCDGSKQDLTTTVTWASMFLSVATVSNAAMSRGLVTANEGGTTTISATLGSITGTTTLKVNGPNLASISVTPTNPVIKAGQSVQFTAIGIYTDASTFDLTQEVSWSSSYSPVATIDANGRAVGVMPGATTIFATEAGIVGSTTLQDSP